MGKRGPSTLLKTFLMMAVCLELVGCVTTTNDPLAQNRDPERAVAAYVQTGMVFMQRNQMQDANRVLTRAQQIDPDSPAVNNALALFFSLEGDKSQTEKYFKKALSSNPDFSQARNNYAAFLFQQGRTEDAIEQLQRVTKDYTYDRRFTAYENLGLCYLKLGQKDKALMAFNRALNLNPDQPVSLLETAQLEFDRGNNLAAQRYLSRYEKLSKPNPRQLWLGIQLERALGDKDKLASYALALKNLFPGSPEYKTYQASKQP